MGWGDEVMVTGRARALQQLDPRKVRLIYPQATWHEAWRNNPRLARPEERGDFQQLNTRPDGLRPYIKGKDKRMWTWRPHVPPAGELYFSPEEEAFGARHAGLVVVEPHIKHGASPNKDWGWIRWNKLAWLLSQKGIRVTQLGPEGTALLSGADWIRTDSMRQASAVLARARAAVLPEGGMHHVCAAVKTPAVVIYGGYISPRVTGYSDQTAFFVGDELGCGMRVPCAHCQKAMASIDPQDVSQKLEALLARTDETDRGAVAAGA